MPVGLALTTFSVGLAVGQGYLTEVGAMSQRMWTYGLPVTIVAGISSISHYMSDISLLICMKFD